MTMLDPFYPEGKPWGGPPYFRGERWVWLAIVIAESAGLFWLFLHLTSHG